MSGIRGRTGESATFLYDGDCAFCSSCARFLERHVQSDARITAWQFEDLVALNVSAEECNEAVQWIEPSGRIDSGPAAIASLLRSGESRLWRYLGRTLQVGPIDAAARPAYRWISRNRHRMPGGTPACSLLHTPSTRLGEVG